MLDEEKYQLFVHFIPKRTMGRKRKPHCSAHCLMGIQKIAGNVKLSKNLFNIGHFSKLLRFLDLSSAGLIGFQAFREESK